MIHIEDVRRKDLNDTYLSQTDEPNNFSAQKQYKLELQAEICKLRDKYQEFKKLNSFVSSTQPDAPLRPDSHFETRLDTEDNRDSVLDGRKHAGIRHLQTSID